MQFPLTHGFGSQSFIGSSQCTPVKPALQEHLNSFPFSFAKMHAEPFRHKFLKSCKNKILLKFTFSINFIKII